MTAPTRLPDTATLHRVFEYVDGNLYWKPRPIYLFPDGRAWKLWNTRFAGREAFTYVSRQGYREGSLFGRAVKAHRIIFKMMTGDEPDVIDHVDRNRLNNRIENLRASSKSENAMNSGLPSNNTSGHKGVSRKGDKWRAYLNGNHVGVFPTIEEAVAAREAAEKELTL